MSNSPAQDFRLILEEDSSIGLEFGVDLFIGELPALPNTAVSLRDYSGRPPEPNSYFESHVNVIVRGEPHGGYPEGYAMAENVQGVLHNYYGTPVPGGFYYAGVWAVHTPQYLGVDESGRPLFSINFRVQRR